MLICPICRNQNMETAKFCGNCGHSFTRSSTSTSSLINCAQGHVYSAVYEHCPYCPQPQVESRDLDFVTRIETPITAVDLPRGTGSPSYTGSMNPNDFATRVDTRETTFETIEAPTIPPPAPPPPAPAPAFAPTEITPPIPPPAAMESADIDPLRVSAAIEPIHEGWSPQAAAPAAAPPGVERRTTVLTDQSAPLRKTKGRIVGWLITYSHNPDGEDYRLYAGYNRIGANPVCDIVIDDQTVSGSHAIIVFRDGRCLIKDDLSRNGTFVNGREITEAQPLQNYDQIRVGNTYLTFVAAQRDAQI